MDPEFIQMRARGLHNYIQHVFSSPVLLRCQAVREFLCGGSIGSITGPMELPKPLRTIDHESSEDDKSTTPRNSIDEQTTNNDSVPVADHDSASNKLKAVFTTTADPTMQTSTVTKSALKKTNSLRRTLKKVAWRRTLFVDTAPASSSATKSREQPATPSSLLYPLGTHSTSSDAKLVGKGDCDYDLPTSPVVDIHSRSVSIDDFYLLKMLGKGNFGKVMLAQHKDNHQVYAIKGN
jgi:hypothetical protein